MTAAASLLSRDQCKRKVVYPIIIGDGSSIPTARELVANWLLTYGGEWRMVDYYALINAGPEVRDVIYLGSLGMVDTQIEHLTDRYAIRINQKALDILK